MKFEKRELLYMNTDASDPAQNIEAQRDVIIGNIVRGIEVMADKFPAVKYNNEIVNRLFEKIKRVVADSSSVRDPREYAFITGKNWAFGLLRRHKRLERAKQREQEAIKAHIENVILETKREVAKQELEVVINHLIENGNITETQKKQLRYLLLSLTQSYEVADESFGDVNRALRDQWRKRAKAKVLKQPISDNLRWYMDNHNLKKRNLQ